MQHDWQIEVAGNLQLPAKILPLQHSVQTVDKEIEAALANGRRLFAFNPLLQQFQMLGTMAIEEHRVQAITGVQAGPGSANRLELRPAGVIGRRQQLLRYTRGFSAQDHSVAIRVELRGIKMAVAIKKAASHRKLRRRDVDWRLRPTILFPRRQQQCAETEQNLVDEGDEIRKQDIQEKQDRGNQKQSGKPKPTCVVKERAG